MSSVPLAVNGAWLASVVLLCVVAARWCFAVADFVELSAIMPDDASGAFLVYSGASNDFVVSAIIAFDSFSLVVVFVAVLSASFRGDLIVLIISASLFVTLDWTNSEKELRFVSKGSLLWLPS